MKLIKNNILTEASESTEEANSSATHRSNVNEYLVAHELGMLAGHGKSGRNYNPRTGLETTPGYFPSDQKAAERRFLASKKKLTKEEYEHQSKRAKEQARVAVETYRRRKNENGGPLDLTKATHVAVSAGSGAIKKLTGHEDAESTENPSDVIARLPGKNGEPDIHAGISAKSNLTDTEHGGERISNRGTKGVSDNLNLPGLHEMYESGMESFGGAHGINHLPQDSDVAEKKPFTRKGVIRASEKKSVFLKGKTIKDDAELVGGEMKTRSRDMIHDWINQHGSDSEKPLNVEMVRQHLLDHHFRAKGSAHPTLPFITVSGHGNGSKQKPYNAHGHFSQENSRVKLLQEATHITASPAGEYGMHIFAHTKKHPEGVHVLKLDSKWNSQPMASSMKIVGTEGDTRKRKPEMLADAEKRQKSAAARAAKTTSKKPVKLNNSFVYLTAAGRELFNEGYEFSGDDAFQMLTLGTDMDDINLNENHKNYLKDSKGNVRIFMIRGAAAKEAHIKGGKVVPYSRGYAVLLEENQNDYHVFEKFIRSESGYNGGQETSSRSTLIAESTESGRNTSDTSGGKEAGQQSYAERKGTLTFKEITARKINESKSSSKENEEITESIDKGIEPGLSMATSGENMMRGAIRNKALKKPLEELTGDETTASIGDQKEDELRKKGISLTTFKKRNYV